MIPRLHLVTDDAVLQQPDFLTTAAAILHALGERVALHVRAPGLPASMLFQIASELQLLAGSDRPFDRKSMAGVAALLVNDRVDVALTTRAQGVHLGSRSLPIAAARRLLGTRLIGYSAHSAAECGAAGRAGADFLFAGSIYPTATHPAATPGGIRLLERCMDACTKPVLAIGGVTAGSVPELRRAGAHGVAVIRAVWAAPDPVQAAQELVKLLET